MALVLLNRQPPQSFKVDTYGNAFAGPETCGPMFWGSKGYSHPKTCMVATETNQRKYIVYPVSRSVKKYVSETIRRHNGFFITCKQTGCSRKIRVPLLDGNKRRHNTFQNANGTAFLGHYNTHNSGGSKKKSVKSKLLFNMFGGRGVMVAAGLAQKAKRKREEAEAKAKEGGNVS